MEKAKVIKTFSADDERTKQKLIPSKHTANQKPTLATRNKRYNQLAIKLISQSQIISQQSTVTISEEDDSVQQVDSMYVEGTIRNVGEFDDNLRKKYGYSYGMVFQVQDYIVVFPGRHQVNFKNGFPVSLYIPSAYKSGRDAVTKKIQVLIQRKIKNQKITDPMQYPYIVVDPKNSIYPTYICSWLECKRKITLQHYIQYEQQTNQCLVYGNAIHRYLEWLIRKQVLPQAPTEKEMRKLYDSFLYQMYLIDTEFELFVEKVQNGIVNLVSWYEAHVVKGKIIELNKYQKKYLKITRTLGSEVMIRSRYFGIRGKVDGLLEGIYTDEKLGQSYTVAVPFQLKTGIKVLDSHKKQVQFYNLLVRQSKNMAVIGLLYYSDSNIVQYRVQNPLISFQNINCHRNRIMINILNLYSESERIILPSLPQTLDQCRLCDVSIQCAVNRLQPQKIIDLEDIADDTPEGHNLNLRQKLKKLTVLQMQYLKKWLNFLHLEECAQRNQSKLNQQKYYHRRIRMNAAQLQKFNRYQLGDTLTIKIHKIIESHEMSQQLDNYFRVGQKLRIFIPLIRVADACRISNICKNTKKFQMQIQMKNDNIKFNKEKCRLLYDSQTYPQIQVQLQRYQNSFYNYTRGYCFNFVLQSQKWLKDIVINETYQPKNKKKMLCSQIQQMQKLNQNQKEAFVRCMQMERFCLVQGMPGTGKTQLIIKLIQYFYKENKTILVTSFNNQALSNILDRQINQHKVILPDHIIRQGSRYGISSQFQFLSSQSQQYLSIEHYKQYFKAKKVWFVTISSLYIHHLPKKFDIVIVDEASQCLQASCLQALIRADKFVLIGDQRQLQPLVKSKTAVELGMQVSLFQKLCNKYKQMTVKLTKQYRMSPAIMNLTNKLVYNGQLQLAQKQMANRKLKIIQQWKTIVPLYLHDIIDPEKSLRFVNYDSALNLFSDEQNIDIRRVKRLLQIRITCCLYRWFRQLGISKDKILIISAYNSIVHQLVFALKKERLIQENNSDVLTIDKSQGTDKQIIIFIFNKGNKQLIQNYRRLNVALTRAKNKFIIVGSYKQLSQLATWTGRLAQLLIPDTIQVQKDMLTGILDEFDIEKKQIRSQQLTSQKQQQL